jgi:hypothetical protein
MRQEGRFAIEGTPAGAQDTMDRLLDEIPELENRLLLYAAGELSAEQAEAVERDLADNPSAREALAQIRDLLGHTQVALSAWEAADKLGPRVVRRARDRAVRAVFEWTEVEAQSRMLRPAGRSALAEGVVWRYARWPLGVAAALVLGLMVWTFGSDPDRMGGNDVAVNPGTTAGTESGSSGTTTTTGGTAQSQSGTRLEQVAAMFDNPAGRWDRDGDSEMTSLEFGNTLSDELAALRLLYEPDWE